MSEFATRFGFEKVTYREKAKRVNEVFTNVSPIYDRMNDFMSLGQHHQWKAHAVTALQVLDEDTVADIACGSGDISILLAPKLSKGQLVCIDPNTSMLEQCKLKLSEYPQTSFIESPAETLSLPFLLNRCIISFGLRNFSDPDLGLKRIYEHLKPGGKLLIMEFNPPQSTLFSESYPQYLNCFLPFLGRNIAGNEASYQYLADSITTQPTPKERVLTLSDIGYQYITYSPLNFGIVGLFEAYKCP